MFVDSVVYLIQSYWLIVIVVLGIGFFVGWRSYTPKSR